MARILVVDDENDFRAQVVAALIGEKFEVLEANNGADALDLAKKHQPDLIVSDVIMDSGTGFMLRELLREDARTAAIPLILMTGVAYKAGAWESDPEIEYLAKPFSVSDLLLIVERKLSPKTGE
jgi:CheY-like chemotaxis protein